MPRPKPQQNGAENVERSLTPAQIKALAVLSLGQSVSDAARAAGIDRTTVHRWLHFDPLFSAEYNAARLEMIQTVKAGVRQLATDALSTLRDLMGPTSPASVRFRAVELVLSQASSGASQIGSPVPEQVQEDFEKRDFKDPLDPINMWLSSD